MNTTLIKNMELLGGEDSIVNIRCSIIEIINKCSAVEKSEFISDEIKEEVVTISEGLDKVWCGSVNRDEARHFHICLLCSASIPIEEAGVKRAMQEHLQHDCNELHTE